MSASPLPPERELLEVEEEGACQGVSSRSCPRGADREMSVSVWKPARDEGRDPRAQRGEDASSRAQREGSPSLPEGLAELVEPVPEGRTSKTSLLGKIISLWTPLWTEVVSLAILRTTPNDSSGPDLSMSPSVPSNFCWDPRRMSTFWPWKVSEEKQSVNVLQV